MISQAEDARTAWDQIAAGFDEFVTGSGMPVAEDGLRRAGLGSGMRVLDVASGSGALSIPAARLGAQVTAVDLSPNMIERLQARARQEGLSNIEARVMDAHALDLPDDMFDIAASQFGVMLVPDLPKALGEMARVTRPGGRVLIIAFVAPQEIDFLGFFLGAMQEVNPGFTGLPTDPPPLPFQVSNSEVLQRRMAEAGLRDIRIERGAEELEIHSGKHLWDWVTNSNPIGRMLVANLTDGQAASVQQALDRRISERAAGAEFATLINPVNIGIGTK
jgi:ubiquinone/menaquinone biosynthesis C-methylase UbiE